MIGGDVLGTGSGHRGEPDGPKAPTPRRALAWGTAGTGLAVVVATLALIAVEQPVGAYPAWSVISAYAIPLLLIGGLIVARRPDQRLGWLLLAQGIGAGVMLATGEYATFSALGRLGRLPFTGAAAWMSSVTQSALVVSLIALALLFPTGRLLSARWRPVAWAVGFDLILGIGTAAFGGPMFNSNIDFIRNPLAIHPPGWLEALVNVGGAIVIPFSLVGVAAHLLMRYRRSAGEEREQLKWFVSASVLAPVIIFLPAILFPDAYDGKLGAVVWTFGPLAIIGAVGVAILRYRLYDIDVVINRALVYGLLAAFITAVYVAIVVGVGAAVGQGSQPNLGLSIVATAVVALAFQPVRHRAQRLANRVVYGHRATPYEVLSELAARLATAPAAEEQLPRMARTLAEGTGAAGATVWLGHGERLRPAASWPPAAGSTSRGGTTLSLAVLHDGVQLGALSLTKLPGERLTPAEERLARDLASHAGLVLHNVRLTEELRARVEELRASRRRLVAAQDAARRRLERNIHDGAQQQLVALSVKTNLARQLLRRDPERAVTLMEGLRGDVERALEDLDELASGLVPTALTELGLAEALRARAARGAVPTIVDAPDDLAVHPDTAGAVYFSVLEALQNVAKYAHASRATVTLARHEGRVEFQVADDGGGFDASTVSYGTGLRGIADRLSAMGGMLDVRSEPGVGTTVSGLVPDEPRRPGPSSETGVTGRGHETDPRAEGAVMGR